MNNLKADLIHIGLDEEQIQEKEPMSKHITFRVGGEADYFVTCNNEKKLATLLAYLTENRIRHMLIGNGSNLLFKDNGYRGVIVNLDGDFRRCEVSGNRMVTGSARLLSSVSSMATEHGLAGLEFASGIPGTMGGAIYMNAGAYGGEMKDLVTKVRLMTPDGKNIFERSADEMEFSYRHSGIQSTGDIVLQVELELTPEDRESIQKRVAELTEKRVSKQPLNYPSAGSTFKRPVGGYAAALIQDAGLKGTAVGGAEVSEKHSGFIVNKGGATAADVLNLMKLVEEKVLETSGIRLEPEVRIIEESEESDE